MKFSKSILLFLFFSSVSVAFHYAFKRTNGNVFKSLQFTLIFLAIKIGLISLNIPLELNQEQPKQVLSKIQPVRYHPYVSVYYDYRPSGLLMESIGHSSSVPQYSYSSYSQNVINEVRAGGPRLRQAAWLFITIWMLQQGTVGFVQQPVRPPVARPPHIQSALDLLFGKPKSPDSRLNSHTGSTNVAPTKIQADKFVKNGGIDLQKAFAEVNRRASVIGSEDFDCSFARFKGLAQEAGQVSTSAVREAISVLEGEMLGYYKNARRGNYGNNVFGPDFVVEGIGALDHITHVEVKGPVGSSIQSTPSLYQKAKKSVERVQYQRNFWSDRTKVEQKISNLKENLYLPAEPENVLGLYDLWDVGTPAEKSSISGMIEQFSSSANDKNFIILNKYKNT